MNGKICRVLVTGLPHFAQRVGALVAGRGWRVTVRTPLGFGNAHRRRFEQGRLLATLPFYDLVYQIGGPSIDERVLRICLGLQRPIVLHWVGSDVSEAKATAVQAQNATNAIVHWVDAPWLQSELDEFGIQSSIMPSSAVAATKASLLPAGPLTVLLYLPDNRWEFYRGPLLIEWARNLPEINFLVVGANGVGRPSAANIRYLGWVKDMTAIYTQCHVYVRMAIHDGLSAMVIEALSHGRHVIWNYPMTGAQIAHTGEEVKAELVQLARDQAANRLLLNQSGKTFTETNFNVTKVAKEIRTGFDAALIEFRDRKVSEPQSRVEAL